jgi:hypothetical protein
MNARYIVLLGLLVANTCAATGIVKIKGVLDSITPTHYIIRTPTQSLVYVRKEDVDPAKRKKLVNLEQKVTIHIDMTKIEMIRDDTTAAKAPPAADGR